MLQKGCRTCRLASRLPSRVSSPVARLCPYSTGSVLAKAWHEGYQKAREEQQGSPEILKAEGNQ